MGLVIRTSLVVCGSSWVVRVRAYFLTHHCSQNGVHVSMLSVNAENRMVFAAAVLMLQVEPNKASLRVALEDNTARRQSQRPAGRVQLAAITSQQQKQHHGNAAIDSNSVSCGTADAGLKKQPAGMFKSCWCACQSDWR